MDRPENDLDSLIDRIFALKRDLKATDHTGRYNRLFTRQRKLLATLEKHESFEKGFKLLLDHPDPEIRLMAASYGRTHPGLTDMALSTLRALAAHPGKVGRDAQGTLEWHEKHPEPVVNTAPSRSPIDYPRMPAGFSSAHSEAEIRSVFPSDRADAVAALLRPSIRLWPKPSSGRLLASRFGGMPAVPAGWTWPFEFEEPLLFLAQIDCAAVRAAAGPCELPDSGMLAFFGDHDDVNGCGPTGGGRAYHFPDIGSLKTAALPLDDFEPLVTCDLDFFRTFEIPDPESEFILSLKLSKDERDTYYDLAAAIRSPQDIPERFAKEYVSKLLGWPDLVQDDLGSFGWHIRKAAQPRLLLQIGWYHDGLNWESWGPGGTVYFTMDENSLVARRFGEVELEVQTT